MRRLSLSFARELAWMGVFGLLDILTARTIQFRLDVVIDPFLVPPFDRQDRQPMKVNAEMQVISRREARFTGFADGLVLLDLISHFNVDGAQVRVEREKAQAMIDDHGIAIDS